MFLTAPSDRLDVFRLLALSVHFLRCMTLVVLLEVLRSSPLRGLTSGKNIVVVPSADKPEALVRKFLDRAF